MNEEKWLLPEGIEEFLPQEANALEDLRRRLLALFATWGYDLVIPPIVEYIDSLLTGSGNDLDLQTFKLIDQANGRSLGIRADMTPQVARIDSHQLSRDCPNRLCYIGTVIHAQSNDYFRSRSIKQIGAELFGHAGEDSDIEVISLMLACIKLLGVEQVHLELGHVQIYRSLLANAGLSGDEERAYFDALLRKSRPDIEGILSTLSLSDANKRMLLALVNLHGGIEVLPLARKQLADGGNDVRQAIDNLEVIAKHLAAQYDGFKLHIDLGELRGYNYHTGIVFTAYAPDHIQAIAQGGRYDNIGAAFGRSRPATGFSADLRTFIKLDMNATGSRPGIFSPNPGDKKQSALIATLRKSGERVICGLSNQMGSAAELGCNRIIEKTQNGDWVVVVLGEDHE
ncbi:MAG: ATP phosphoribosyltransferase regulatory subunit [Thiohalomonadales bacterium]